MLLPKKEFCLRAKEMNTTSVSRCVQPNPGRALKRADACKHGCEAHLWNVDTCGMVCHIESTICLQILRLRIDFAHISSWIRILKQRLQNSRMKYEEIRFCVTSNIANKTLFDSDTYNADPLFNTNIKYVRYLHNPSPFKSLEFVQFLVIMHFRPTGNLF